MSPLSQVPVFRDMASLSTLDPLEHIAKTTASKVHVFLTELASGTSNYRSLHRLTQQVEHQYAGRFLIELIQNAHDALIAPAAGEAGGRIAMLFDVNDSTYGSLLVANDGQPFSSSNFERLSQLGQSDKDPQENIGNKGIGFRSVLEICDVPEVYSRASQRSHTFDGYCFRFDPSIVDALLEPMLQFANGVPVRTNLACPEQMFRLTGEDKVLFAARIKALGGQGIKEELRHLSPYLLPQPIDRVCSTAVHRLEQDGFSTVIRLPVKSAADVDYTRQKLAEFSPQTTLFLSKVSSLQLGGAEKGVGTFTRRENGVGQADERRVVLSDSAQKLETYAVWSKELHLADAPEAVRVAVSKLPEPWPDIKRVVVEVAVRLGGDPTAGSLCIFLPTRLATGSAVHVQAPFFGDMSRTSIDFEDPFNRYLLDAAADLVLDVARKWLARRGESEAQVLVDLLAPYGTASSGVPSWLDLLEAAAERTKASLAEESLALTENGWRALNVTSRVPNRSGATVLTEQVLRQHATFEVFHPCLRSREAQLEALTRHLFPENGIDPLESELAETVAAAAAALSQGMDWNAFWRDVMGLLPSGQAELAKYPVLIGGDGLLHRASDGCSVFFLPRQGTPDDGELDGTSGTTDVPPSLRDAVAFLSEELEVYVPNRAPPQQNALHKYLANGLVAQSRVETLFATVLLKRIPALPVPLEGADANLCKEILHWALRLVDNADRRGRGAEATLKHLNDIPVPCSGGWYPMSAASFGPGWEGTSGAVLATYLNALTGHDAVEARRRLLLGPNAAEWEGANLDWMRWLKSGGVADGLRLTEIAPSSWNSWFSARASNVPLPEVGPKELGVENWRSYRQAVAHTASSPFASSHVFEVGTLSVFPGMAEMGGLPAPVRIALSELILRSLPGWRKGLEPTYLRKTSGTPTNLKVRSPLRWLLEDSPWLATKEREGYGWEKLANRWHVPANVMSNRLHHFSHLAPLPPDLARRLDATPDLASALYGLGLSRYDMDEPSVSPKLLETLVAAIGSEEVTDSNNLLGQIRGAWQVFRPSQTQPPLERLPVRQADRQLRVYEPTVEEPVFVPDSAAYVSELESLGKPVLPINTNDARELRPWFQHAYGERVVLTSSLTLVPRVGGRAWTGEGATPLALDDAGWLIKPVLSLVAFCGASPGIHASRFRQLALLLQESHVHWVSQLQLELQKQGQTLLTTEVDAFWHDGRRTLIASSSCQHSPVKLAPSLVQLLGREDLAFPLRLLLTPLEAIENEPADLVAFLGPLEVSGEQLYQVLEFLRGDVTQTAKLLSVLVAVCDPTADLQELRAALTEDQLRKCLEKVPRLPLDAQLAIRMAREGHDFFAFGKLLSERMALPLARWNEGLKACGYPVVTNRNWKAELEASLEEAESLVKRALAHIQRVVKRPDFRQRWRQYTDLVSSNDFSQTHWEVRFQDAMQIVSSLVEKWEGAAFSSAIANVDSADALRDALVRCGVDVDFDPDECARQNSELAETLGRQLDQLRDAFAVKRGDESLSLAEPLPSTVVKAVASKALERDGFVRKWSAGDLLEAVRSEAGAGASDVYWLAVEKSSDIETLRAALELTQDDVSRAEEWLARRKADAARSRRLVKVCGADFDSDPDNLGVVWRFISARVPDEEVGRTPLLALTKPAELDSFKKKRKTAQGQPAKPSKRPQRQSKAVDELVGLVGEIFVFRRLQLQFKPAISSDAWVSKNSQYAFPNNAGDDSLGYDIGFTVNGTSYRVEVKATAGDDESFTLGSSEIRLAQELGAAKKRKRPIYLVAHVKQALSASPSVVILPNPFDPKYSGLFSISDADARLRYRSVA